MIAIKFNLIVCTDLAILVGYLPDNQFRLACLWKLEVKLVPSHCFRLFDCIFAFFIVKFFGNIIRLIRTTVTTFTGSNFWFVVTFNWWKTIKWWVFAILLLTLTTSLYFLINSINYMDLSIFIRPNFLNFTTFVQ